MENIKVPKKTHSKFVGKKGVIEPLENTITFVTVIRKNLWLFMIKTYFQQFLQIQYRAERKKSPNY